MIARRLIQIFLLLIGFGFFAAACVGGGAPPPANQAAPTYFVTQYVTQIVATVPTSTPEPEPTSTPWPTPTLEWDPFAVPVSFPLVGCPGSRLQVGGMAFVAMTDSVAYLYSTYDTDDDPGMRKLVNGEKMYIMDGAWCSTQRKVMWQVYMLSDQRIGFVAEGDGNIYWLLPLSPKEPTPRVRP